MKFKILASNMPEMDWSERLHIKMLKMVIQNQQRMIDLLTDLLPPKDGD